MKLALVTRVLNSLPGVGFAVSLDSAPCLRSLAFQWSANARHGTPLAFLWRCSVRLGSRVAGSSLRASPPAATTASATATRTDLYSTHSTRRPSSASRHSRAHRQSKSMQIDAIPPRRMKQPTPVPQLASRPGARQSTPQRPCKSVSNQSAILFCFRFWLQRSLQTRQRLIVLRYHGSSCPINIQKKACLTSDH